MKLITKEMEKTFSRHPLYSGEYNKDPQVIAKFFCGRWTWYVTEAERQKDGGWLFFGLVTGDFPEMGYFTSYDLERTRARVEVEGLGYFHIGVERDKYFTPCKLSEIKAALHI